MPNQLKAWRSCFGRRCIGLRADSSDFDPTLSVTEQTQIALDNLEQVLLSAGSSFDNVVKTTVFLSRIEDMPAMNEVYRRRLVDGRAIPPARSAVEVANLPCGAKFEIEAIGTMR